MKIVISGTYSTGKTTLSLALSYLTGIPATHARTMREILPAAFPGYSLEQCGSSQLIELGIRRFAERIQAELKMGDSFISDGCSLQEWLYGSTRLKTGFNPSEDPETVKKWQNNHFEEWQIFQQTIHAFGKVVKEYAKNSYDTFIHLPVEFPYVPDGHRPASEYFRNESDKLLTQTYQELGIHPLEVHGNIQKRLSTIVGHMNLDQVMSVKDAIQCAMVYKKHKFDHIQQEKSKHDLENFFNRDHVA